MRYYLGDVELAIRIVDLDDLSTKESQPLKASSLKKLVNSFDKVTLLVTPTMPHVFFCLLLQHTRSRTHHMAYRAFLGFVGQLHMMEEPDSPGWIKLGF